MNIVLPECEAESEVFYYSGYCKDNYFTFLNYHVLIKNCLGSRGYSFTVFFIEYKFIYLFILDFWVFRFIDVFIYLLFTSRFRPLWGLAATSTKGGFHGAGRGCLSGGCLSLRRAAGLGRLGRFSV